MRQITLSIPEKHYLFFTELINKLGFVTIENEIPKWQKEETLQTIAKIKRGEVTTRDWNTAKKELF